MALFSSLLLLFRDNIFFTVCFFILFIKVYIYVYILWSGKFLGKFLVWILICKLWRGLLMWNAAVWKLKLSKWSRHPTAIPIVYEDQGTHPCYLLVLFCKERKAVGPRVRSKEFYITISGLFQHPYLALTLTELLVGMLSQIPCLSFSRCVEPDSLLIF